MQISPEALRAVRLAQGETQQNLATRAGITVATLQNLERGRSRGFDGTIEALAKALNVPVRAITLAERRAS
jgi:transcriptional regulator with XRE-family HTH domain